MTSERKKSDWRSYLCLLVLQAQNAFNDKFSQFLIIPLAAWLTSEGGSYEYMPHLLAVMIVSPYLIFAPTVGWISDQLSKTHVVRIAVVLQIAVIGGLVYFSNSENLWGMVSCFFLLSLQSTFLNPAKRGAIKEYVGQQRLGLASGVFEMSIILAVCIGQIVAGYTFADGVKAGASGWSAVSDPLSLVLIMCSVPILISWFMRTLPAQGREPFHARVLTGHFAQLRMIWSQKELKLSALGKSFFWGYGGFLNLLQITMALELAEVSSREYGSVLSGFMVAASAGIIIGGIIASILCRNRIELGLIPIAGGMMALGTLMLACSPIGSSFMYVAFALSGFAGAMFMVPINANLQDKAPPAGRGKVLAGASVLDCVMGLAAVALQGILMALNIPFTIQCVILGGITFCVTVYVTRIVPKSFLQFIVRVIFRVLYRVKVTGAEHLPKEGGVLLTPNHVSYVDALILSVASPRPVRFMMIRECFDVPGVRWFANLADTIAISPARAKEAIRLAAEAIDEGTVVCIFPEGQLTRTGALCELKKGFQLIARKANCPVVPVYMDGLWGSLFSFERGRFFKKMPKKIPYGVRVNFGCPIRGEKVNPVELRRSLFRLSAACFSQRNELNHPSWIVSRLKRQMKRTRSTWERESYQTLLEMNDAQRSILLYNALQIREMGFVQKRQSVAVEPGVDAQLVFILLGVIVRWKVDPLTAQNSEKERTNYDLLFIKNENQLVKQQKIDAIVFVINGSPVSTTSPAHYPLTVENGKVFTISCPHPPMIKPTDQPQFGWKQGSTGRILPGCENLPNQLDQDSFVKGLEA